MDAAKIGGSSRKKSFVNESRSIVPGDPRLDAAQAFVAGFVAQAQGDHNRANNCYRKAFALAADVPHLRRAAIASHVVTLLSQHDELRPHVLKAVKETQSVADRFTKTLAFSQSDRVSLARHPVFASLSSIQKEVVVLICQGKTNTEIARLRNVGVQTIKNMVTMRIFPAFGVPSRAALVSVCLGGEGSTGTKQRKRSRQIKEDTSAPSRSTPNVIGVHRQSRTRSTTAGRGKKKRGRTRRSLKAD